MLEMTSDTRRWYSCTCEIDGIRHSCFRPEYFIQSDLDNTSIVYRCRDTHNL